MAAHGGTDPGFYDHLNKRDTAPFDIVAAAKTVCGLNYGLHRFLSEVIRIKESEEPGCSTAAALRALLEGGHY